MSGEETKNESRDQKRKKCFIIMPITTPRDLVERYKGDADHFKHVLEHLFIPAVVEAGFEPIPPKSTGSDVIQAEIIKQLSSCELELCDMSILNPNVFFEFGIRTALDKPVALTVDDKTQTVPFDTIMLNFYRYDSSLVPWTLDEEKRALARHIKDAYEKNQNYNALWKYFGVAQTGSFKPEEAELGDKMGLLMQEVSSLRDEQKKLGRLVAPHGIVRRSGFRLPSSVGEAMGQHEGLAMPTYQELMEKLNSLKAQEKNLETD